MEGAMGCVDGADERPDGSAAHEAPRLGILHLLVWTGGICVCLGPRQMAIQIQGYGTAYNTMELLCCPAFGAALGGLLMWVARRWRGVPFPVHPGEFLLILAGVGTAANSLEVLLIGVCPCGVVPLAVLSNLALASICVWAVRGSLDPIWRGFFVLAVAYVLSSLGIYFPDWSAAYGALRLRPVWGWVATVALIAALVRGFCQHRRFPWTHWLGISIGVWLSAVDTAHFLFLRYFR